VTVAIVVYKGLIPVVGRILTVYKEAMEHILKELGKLKMEE
jgi:hypothetical protein